MHDKRTVPGSALTDRSVKDRYDIDKVKEKMEVHNKVHLSCDLKISLKQVVNWLAKLHSLIIANLEYRDNWLQKKCNFMSTIG